MTQRDILVELLNEADKKCDATKTDQNGDCICAYDVVKDCFFTMIADYLIDNGVIVLPVKVGDVVYQILGTKDGHRFYRQTTVGAVHLSETKRNHRYQKDTPYIVLKVDDMYCAHVNIKEIGRTVFLTKEEAERALAERRENENL